MENLRVKYMFFNKELKERKLQNNWNITSLDWNKESLLEHKDKKKDLS